MLEAETSPPLPDDEFSVVEWTAFSLIAFGLALPGLAFLLGQFADYWAIWDIIDENFVAPIVGEGSGDSNYNVYDTTAYALLLVSFIVAISALLRVRRFPAREQAIFALLPWILWAVLVEVSEDAGMFRDSVEALFVSPLIHFQTAFWIVLVGFIAPAFLVDNSPARSSVESSQGKRGAILWGQLDDEKKMRYTPYLMMLFIMLIHITLFYPPDSLETLISFIAAFAIVKLFFESPSWGGKFGLQKWNPVEKSLFYSGIGACSLIGVWLIQVGISRSESGNLELWPAIWVLGGPLLLSIYIYQWGATAREQIPADVTAGVLPAGLSLDAWDQLEGAEHEAAESVIGRAAATAPAVMLTFWGQLVDGCASWVGVDRFGYTEKHVLSEWVMRVAGGEDGGAGGGWGFALVKLALATVVLLFFAEMRFERRYRHLRLLIILGLLTVGMAPGLRDLGRMMLGV